MAITVVQHRSTSSGASNVTTLTLAFSSNNTAGNTLIYVSSTDGTSAGELTAATDNNGNTIVNAALQDPGGSGAVRVDFVKACNAGANTVTANDSGGLRLHLHIWEISGLQSDPLDQTNKASQAATNQSISTSSATTVATELILGAFYDFTNDDSLTAGSGFSPSEFTDGGSGFESLLSEVKIVSSTGVQTATATSGGGATSTIQQIIATFKGVVSNNPAFEDDTFNASLNGVLVQQPEPIISVW